MTVSAAKPEEKRLGWFVPTAVDQAESCVKPAAEGRTLARMPNPQHSETERLDHGPNWLKHTEDGLLLGECRYNVLHLQRPSRLFVLAKILQGSPTNQARNLIQSAERGLVKKIIREKSELGCERSSHSAILKVNNRIGNCLVFVAVFLRLFVRELTHRIKCLSLNTEGCSFS